MYPAGSWMFSGWWYVHRFSTASMSWILSTLRTSRSVKQETLSQIYGFNVADVILWILTLGYSLHLRICLSYIQMFSQRIFTQLWPLTVTAQVDLHTPSDWTPAALLTRWSASSMASAGPRGKSRDRPITRMRISVSSNKGTSEQRRRKKLKRKRENQFDKVTVSKRQPCSISKSWRKTHFLSLSGGQLSHL